MALVLEAPRAEAAQKANQIVQEFEAAEAKSSQGEISAKIPSVEDKREMMRRLAYVADFEAIRERFGKKAVAAAFKFTFKKSSEWPSRDLSSHDESAGEASSGAVVKRTGTGKRVSAAQAVTDELPVAEGRPAAAKDSAEPESKSNSTQDGDAGGAGAKGEEGPPAAKKRRLGLHSNAAQPVTKSEAQPQAEGANRSDDQPSSTKSAVKRARAGKQEAGAEGTAARTASKPKAASRPKVASKPKAAKPGGSGKQGPVNNVDKAAKVPPPPVQYVDAPDEETQPRAQAEYDAARFRVAPGTRVVFLVRAFAEFVKEHEEVLRSVGMIKSAADVASTVAGKIRAWAKDCRGAAGTSCDWAAEVTAVERTSDGPEELQHLQLRLNGPVILQASPASALATAPLELTVPWMDARASALQSFPFVVHEDAYRESAALPVFPGFCFRTQFPTAEDPTIADWYEGRVYDHASFDAFVALARGGTRGREDESATDLDWLLSAPSLYKSLHVIWYDLGIDVSLMQTDNELSPWDAFRSPAVRRQPRADDEVPVRLAPQSSPADVYRFLVRQECACIFKQPVRFDDVPHYYTVIQQPMDFRTIHRKLKRGTYDSRMDLLLADVELMVANAKAFNQPERREWRFAHMLGCLLNRVRVALAPDA